MSSKSYCGIRRIILILLVMVCVPTINAGYFSKSFMKAFSAKMYLNAQKKCMNFSITHHQLEKEYNLLILQENPDKQKILDISYKLWAYKDSVESGKNNVEFWERVYQSYNDENTTADTPPLTNTRKSIESTTKNDNIIFNEKTIRCFKCAGTGKCFMCHGKGFIPFSNGEICYCLGLGTCSSCNGKGSITIIQTLDKTTGYYTSVTSDGFATNGFANGSNSTTSKYDSPSYDSSSYMEMYRSFERNAESIYNSITIKINNRGDRISDVSNWNHSSSYSTMAQEYVRIQFDMKRLRAEALKEGIRISPSIWETKTIRY